MVQFDRYGILRSETREFAISDLRDFLNRNGEAYKAEISPFIRSDMPPSLLPEVPDLDVLGRLFEKRTEVEIKLRRAIVVFLNVRYGYDERRVSEAIAESLRPRSDRRDPKDLFVGRAPQDAINELYTADLADIILANWNVFEPLLGNNKDRFKMNMDTVNRARRIDAHSKPASEEEIDEFDNSYTWLLARLARMPK